LADKGKRPFEKKRRPWASSPDNAHGQDYRSFFATFCSQKVVFPYASPRKQIAGKKEAKIVLI
jgi:hypothetical protein